MITRVISHTQSYCDGGDGKTLQFGNNSGIHSDINVKELNNCYSSDDDWQLASTVKHKRLREEADKRYRDNAKKMQLKYSKGKRKKVVVFHPGDFVSVRVPKIDRASTDCHCLPCIVVQSL